MVSSEFLISATIATLREALHAGELSCVELVSSCLSQIRRYDGYLKATISIAPDESVLRFAAVLDDEITTGRPRGPLHGIPVLVKDNIATDCSLGMDTTAGTLSLVGSVPTRHATVVQRIVDAGGVIIAKANLSELSWYKSAKAPAGWSPVGGQTQSAYVRGGFRKDDSGCGHSNPGGSSSGSAVGVSSGYAPVSIGTETNGSLVIPANRASLYTIKPTVGSTPSDGIVPISKFCDSPGPMAKCAADIATLMDILTGPRASETPSYLSAVTGSWFGLRVGTLHPDAVIWPEDVTKQEPCADLQMRSEVLEAYSRIAELASSYAGNVSLSQGSSNEDAIGDMLSQLFKAKFADELSCYLKGLQSSKVRSLEELIHFNRDHADRELPPEAAGQEFLEDALNPELSDTEVHSLIDNLRRTSREAGLDRIFDTYDINILLGPAESQLTTWAAGAGYPIASLPLGVLQFNGRPHGMAAVALAHKEDLLVQLMSAWEAAFPSERTMAQLQGFASVGES